ncbi:DUF2975 domain-containing protein [Pedobacter psychrodurus]|uniref:DUF2975 domain-containing protein n=1 Tax=Pedobacter psychrodurus TaxID=2530456 RepID=UPI00292DCA44|nr:DUF2975 domain-containing protein [Pedobacter psychrodurus]
MKLSESKVIKRLNELATIALVFYIVVLLIKLFSSGVPSASKGVKWYDVYNVKAEKYLKNNEVSANNALDTWFENKIVVNETKSALISIRFKTYSELFSLSAITFQLAYFIYFISIGCIILSVKRFFKSLTLNEAFTKKNASIILFCSIMIISLPITRWLTQELFINCIRKLNLNDSGYHLSNGVGLLSTETIIGLVLMAFGLAFKVGVDIKQENEAFV